jgi:PhzF family phenazine biosynthesis protein
MHWSRAGEQTRAQFVSKRLDIWRVNAFTDTPFTGNPAGVVPDADDLSVSRMQSIAAELNDVSETAFISRPTVPDADLRLRYFTSTTEVDLCGHATISALFTLAWLGRQAGRDETKTIRAQTPVGVLELGLRFDRGELREAIMEQLEPHTMPAPGAALAADILGLPQGALAADLPVACASTGIWACFVPLNDVSRLAAIEVDNARVQELWPDNDELSGVYPFAFIDQCTTQGRFFSLPKYGIVEDPVTGTASGALGGYLIDNGRMPASGVLTARQGIEMGRGGQVTVAQNPNGRMRIGGRAVPIFRGELLA